MDAELEVYLLLQKLQNLLPDEAIAMTPKVKDQLQRTTHQLNLPRQSMKEGERNQVLAVEMNSSQWTTSLMRALFCMDDAIDKMKELISKTNGLLKDKQHLDIQDVADSNILGPSQHRRWERIFGFCFDDESHVVGLEEQV
ncbi:hypothetical protein DITRI_Ditri02bG0071600 [Diplodiscus trichospermus]